MKNYSKLIYQMKEKIFNFSKNIVKGLTKPQQKFIIDMIYGLLASNSVMLSEIARELKEEITLKKSIERLSRNLNAFTNGAKLYNNYIAEVKPMISRETLLVVDDSDIEKQNSKALEYLGTVRDGSTGEKCVKGYHMFEINVLTTKEKIPIPVYSRIYSNTEKGFVSANEESEIGLKEVIKQFDKKGIYVLDRGFDANSYYKLFKRQEANFIIRAKTNRNVIVNGESINIEDLSKKLLKTAKSVKKGKYKLRVASITVELADLNKKNKLFPNENQDAKVNLVVIKHKSVEPMLLLTSLECIDKNVMVEVFEYYILRWRIEEKFRFKKQQFDLENIRVRSLDSIRNLDLILTVVIGFIGIFAESRSEKTKIFDFVIKESKRVGKLKNFMCYAIACGIKNVFMRSDTGINIYYKFVRPKNIHSEQLTLFNIKYLDPFKVPA